MASVPRHVAIIGAGISGLCLALALHQCGIPATVYEVRAATFVQGGAIALSPNALQVLHKLGVYERIRNKSFQFQTLTFKDDHDDITDVYYFGHKDLYGYNALRVSRQVVIEEVKLKLSERNIEVKYNMRFAHVISESTDVVIFAFTDGTTSSASMLIGADGIHSTVRKYMYPTVTPRYLGLLGIASVIPLSSIRLPKRDYPLPAMISARPGTLLILPQEIDGSEVFIHITLAYPEQSREGWNALHAGTDDVVRLFQKDMHAWPDVVQSALENINEDTLFTWPYYAVPRLEQWASDGKGVVLIGDAAHGVPPSTGQGANQAIEDAYMLASFLGKLGEKLDLADALGFWQAFRQERMDRIVNLTDLMTNRRLPLAERAKLPESAVWKGSAEDTQQMSWLYGANLEQVVNQWVGQREG